MTPICVSSGVVVGVIVGVVVGVIVGVIVGVVGVIIGVVVSVIVCFGAGVRFMTVSRFFGGVCVMIISRLLIASGCCSGTDL